MQDSRSCPLSDLSEKQLEALALAARGYTAKEAARELDLSPRAIEVRIEAARRALGNVSRSDAIKIFHAHNACGNSTCGPFPVPPPARNPAPVASQFDGEEVVFHSAALHQAAPWDHLHAALLPGAKPAEVDTRQRLFGVLLGAVVIALLLLLLISVAAGLENLIQP